MHPLFPNEPICSYKYVRVHYQPYNGLYYTGRNGSIQLVCCLRTEHHVYSGQMWGPLPHTQTLTLNARPGYIVKKLKFVLTDTESTSYDCWCRKALAAPPVAGEHSVLYSSRMYGWGAKIDPNIKIAFPVRCSCWFCIFLQTLCQYQALKHQSMKRVQIDQFSNAMACSLHSAKYQCCISCSSCRHGKMRNPWADMEIILSLPGTWPLDPWHKIYVLNLSWY